MKMKMEMELRIPSAAVEFNFESACNSPSTPRGFSNFFFSAPTSPTRFNWEQTQLILPLDNDQKQDHEFDFNTQLHDSPPLSADQLFDCGMIKPIQQNPESKFEEFNKVKNFSGAFRRTPGGQPILSVSKEEESSKEDSSSSLRSDSSSSWSRRWKIRDLLLFRSASEGREGYNKTQLLKKSEIEDVKNSIYSSTAVVNSVHIAKKKKEKTVSAHELHYILNREVAEQMRRKTFLPYKRTVFLGC